LEKVKRPQRFFGGVSFGVRFIELLWETEEITSKNNTSEENKRKQRQ
jgi:hypothetical protein